MPHRVMYIPVAPISLARYPCEYRHEHVRLEKTANSHAIRIRCKKFDIKKKKDKPSLYKNYPLC